MPKHAEVCYKPNTIGICAHVDTPKRLAKIRQKRERNKLCLAVPRGRPQAAEVKSRNHGIDIPVVGHDGITVAILGITAWFVTVIAAIFGVIMRIADKADI